MEKLNYSNKKSLSNMSSVIIKNNGVIVSNEYKDLLTRYFDDFRNLPLLSFKEEQQLFKKVASNDSKAKDKIIVSNLRLVIVIAKKYSGYGVPLLDLIQEGNIGLLKAIEKFDYKKKNKFSTYAYWWIKESISRYLLLQSNVIRYPVYTYEISKRYSAIEQKLVQELGRKPTNVEVSNKFQSEYEFQDFKVVEDIRNYTISLDQNITDNDDSKIIDIIPDSSDVSPTIYCSRNSLHSLIYDCLTTLTKREQLIIVLRYGLDGNEALTLNETAILIGVSKERIRQIEFRAIKKLRHPCKEKHLEDYRYD